MLWLGDNLYIFVSKNVRISLCGMNEKDFQVVVMTYFFIYIPNIGGKWCVNKKVLYCFNFVTEMVYRVGDGDSHHDYAGHHFGVLLL